MNKNDIKNGFLTNVHNKENVYLLGLLWADGWITNKEYNHSICLQMVKDDFSSIETMFRKWGVNTFYDRQRKKDGISFGRLTRMTRIQHKNIVDFLIQNDYDKKSGYSPTKILSLIPENLRYYFWRGYIDGDGCISAKSKKREVALWSVIHQDWSFAISLANMLDITYQIYTYNRRDGKHKSSVFRIGSIDDIIKFCEYIYKDYDGIGLKRKYDKYLQCKILQENTHRKTSKYVGVFFVSRTGRWGANKYNPVTKRQKHIGWFPTEEEAYSALKSC